MSDHVSQETPSYTPSVAQQIAQKAAGRRKKVMHGGSLCSGCYVEPPLPGQRYGRNCHNQYEKDRRLRVKQRAAENQNTSKGKDHGQSEGSGRGGETS